VTWCFSEHLVCALRLISDPSLAVTNNIALNYQTNRLYQTVGYRVTTRLENLDNLEKSGNSKVVREKSEKMEKSQGK